jgi:exopolysaccharide biosynthesis predicted pyruvyltransferase EpsI
MTPDDSLSFEQSKQRILDAIGEPTDVTFVRGFGNVGDLLIHAGIRQMLSSLDYREISIFNLDGVRGNTAVFPGAGGFCHAHHKIPAYMAELEARFERVIVLPSSFDVSVDSVRAFLQQTRAHVFARERESYRQIQGLCRADLAHDCAFYFEFEPYRRCGNGILTVCRTDRESALRSHPIDNNDISQTCETLDEFLWTISRHELIRTDRAHVMIAAAMIGKRVEYWPSNYHKLNAIAEFSLTNFPVLQIEPCRIQVDSGAASTAASSTGVAPSQAQYDYWRQCVQFTARDIEEAVPTFSECILVDACQLPELPVYNRLFLPFIERGREYFGAPSDSQEAIMELERMRGAGAAFMILAWTAFWWTETYPEFVAYLRAHYSCKVDNERVIIFELHTGVD